MRAYQVLCVIAVAAVTVAASACGSLPVVPVDGLQRDLEPLAGQWLGEYDGDGADHRSGNIMFVLVAGEDHAHGDVLMTSARGRGASFDESSIGRWQDPFGDTHYLMIRFVRVDRTRVSGAMDPYWDPDRGCWAETIFEGIWVDNTIAGRFRTRFSLPLPQVVGSWKVTRRGMGDAVGSK